MIFSYTGILRGRRMSEQFQAYQIGKNDDGQRCVLTQLDEGDLMEGDVTVDVEYTTLNYKDGLALTGRSPEVRAHVLDSDEGRLFVERTFDYLTYLLPRFQREGKTYLTVAVGCTGGLHRSVSIVSALAERFEESGVAASTLHRDIEGEGA